MSNSIPLPDWRAVLAEWVHLSPDEEAHMDKLAQTHPEMVMLICKRMRAAAERWHADYGVDTFKGQS